MTPQKYSQLKAKIIEAVPEVMVSEYILCPNCGPTPAHTTSYGGTYSIPRPITLCDVLRAIDTTRLDYVVNLSGYFLKKRDNEIFEPSVSNLFWKFEKDSLDDQSDELKDFLYSLLCNQ